MRTSPERCNRGTARYAPNFGDELIVPNDPSRPALASQDLQRHAIAVYSHLRIVTDAMGALDVNDVVK